MIDTIIIRIHNLSKYPVIYEQYNSYSKKKNGMVATYVNEDTGELIENTYSLKYFYHDSSKFIPLVNRSSVSLASSHYSISYSVETTKDYIEFNFSIPKYKYGTNVFQFINWYDQSSQIIFAELKVFIDDFLMQMLAQQPLPNDVEVNRIDLCYNQMFNCKADALLYLEEQKKLLHHYSRSSKNRYRSYETSFMYTTDNYSFKIYHKGTEFAKNDTKEILKFNTANKLRQNKVTINNTPLTWLQEQADCMLRYEMTFRRGMLKYLFDQAFLSEKGRGSEERATEIDGHSVSRFLKYVAQEDRGRRLSRDFKDGDKTNYEFWKSHAKMFTLKSAFDETRDPYILLYEHRLTFDLTMFNMCRELFFKKIAEYQLYTVTDYGELRHKINELSALTKAKSSMSTAKADYKGKDPTRLFLLALIANSGLDLGALKGYIPRTTYYRLIKDAQKVGIGFRTSGLNIPMPRTDYLDYKLAFKHVQNV